MEILMLQPGEKYLNPVANVVIKDVEIILIH